jgi:uncharacterized protein YgiM (DUF1202 family)
MIRILASMALFIALAASAAATEPLYVQVATELRQSATEVSRSLRSLQAGDSVESYGRKGDWVNVRVAASESVPEAKGWVHYTKVGPSPPSDQP